MSPSVCSPRDARVARQSVAKDSMSQAITKLSELGERLMPTFNDTVKQDVLKMYMRHPYPSYSQTERRNIFAAELCRYRYLGLEPVMSNARLIDVGCGTGHRVI